MVKDYTKISEFIIVIQSLALEKEIRLCIGVGVAEVEVWSQVTPVFVALGRNLYIQK